MENNDVADGDSDEENDDDIAPDMICSDDEDNSGNNGDGENMNDEVYNGNNSNSEYDAENITKMIFNFQSRALYQQQQQGSFKAVVSNY